jgi:PhoPQ-activated pathogenicity-related protein
MEPTRMSVLVRRLPVSLAVAAAVLSPLTPHLSPSAHADLFTYVAKPDDAFKWELRETQDKPNGKIHDLSMVSQVWQGITWEHHVQVYEPKEVKYPKVLPLLITGGDPGAEEQGMGLMVANLVGARVSVLYNVPNQPLFGGLNEDALISYTWMKYMETGDEDWIVNFAMTKAAVRAMDCLDAFAKQQWGTELEGFVPFGASKRGWTTYLTGVVAPDRCVGIAPMVFDILNMPVQIQHQKDFWGDYSPMIHDYTDKGIQQLINTDRGFRLSWMVDPYNFRDKLTMPKLVILGSNDPYWPADAVNLYYPGLPNPKLLLIDPNSRHGLDDLARVAGSLAGFFTLLAQKQPLPSPLWQWDETPEGLKLTVTSTPKPDETRLWVARNTKRDFRPAKWEEQPLPAEGDAFTASVARPDAEYLAAYGELVYMVGAQRLTVSTQPYVLHPK